MRKHNTQYIVDIVVCVFYQNIQSILNGRIPYGNRNGGVKWIQREMAADFLQLVKYYENNEDYLCYLFYDTVH